MNLYEKAGYTKLMQALKLRASQLERSTVELPNAGETTAEIKKVVEERKAPELKEENSETKHPKPSAEKVGVGGDVKDSLIVAGSGNVINIGEQKKPAPEKPKPEKPQPKKTKSPRKPNTAIIVVLTVLAGTVCAALITTPLLANLFSRTPESATYTPDSFVTPVTPSTLNASLTATKTVALTQVAALPTTTALPTALPTEITDAKGVLMMLVLEGEFIMGKNASEALLECQNYFESCEQNWFLDVNPLHRVDLESFYMDKYEVTNSRYKLCVNEGECNPPIYRRSMSQTSYFGNNIYNNYPVMFITWEMARAYCEWRGARLPTEAEWEKSARGTDGRTFPWGEEYIVSNANIGAQATPDDPTEVGAFVNDISPYGIFDMAGNVSEWVADRYSLIYYQDSPSINPTGPELGEYRVVRGGNWRSHPVMLFTYSRSNSTPIRYDFFIGIRCAKDANP